MKRKAHKRKVHRAPANEHAVTDLYLFIETTRSLYDQDLRSFRPNLRKKMASGKYDRAKAVKLYEFLVKRGVDQYQKEMGGVHTGTFNPATREEVAKLLRDRFENEEKFAKRKP